MLSKQEVFMDKNVQRAFPTHMVEEVNLGGMGFKAMDRYFDGMTLADYFAAKIMQGFASNRIPTRKDVEVAYGIARSMIEERSK
jgi:hypothetical protein